jgi:hypothetical protein
MKTIQQFEVEKFAEAMQVVMTDTRTPLRRKVAFMLRSMADAIDADMLLSEVLEGMRVFQREILKEKP